MDDLGFLSANDVVKLVQTKEIAARELVGAILERISAVNPSINAIVTVREESAAFADAEVVDKSGRQLALAGVPFAIKDIRETLELPTTSGSRAFEGYQTSFEADLVRRLRAAGAILIGKTNTPEFGFRVTTENRLFGPTRNPWNTAFDPGGSSGGAAAANAAGLVTLAHGTDSGGSIRNPASHCNVVGLKPSRGLVPPTPGSYEVWAGLGSDGPMARTVRDVALMLDVVSGPSPGTPYSLTPPDKTFASACDESVPVPLRIGYTVTPPHGKMDQEVADAVTTAAHRFESLGHEVFESPIDLTGLERPFTVINAANSAVVGRRIPPHLMSELEPTTINRIMYGNSLSAADYCAAVNEARAIAARIMKAWDEMDVLVCPVSTTLPTPVGALPTSFDMEAIWRENNDISAFTYPFNVTGQPALSVPASFSASDSLPIGIQLVGRPANDRLLLMLGEAYERLFPWAHLRPPLDSAISNRLA